MKIYELENEDITNVGGPMGHPNTRSFTRWTKMFKSLKKAKAYAEADFAVNPSSFAKSITWAKYDTYWSSQDLGHTMYNIVLRKVK